VRNFSKDGWILDATIVCCDNMYVCVYWVKVEEIINSVWFWTSDKWHLIVQVSNMSGDKGQYFTEASLPLDWNQKFVSEEVRCGQEGDD